MPGLGLLQRQLDLTSLGFTDFQSTFNSLPSGSFT